MPSELTPKQRGGECKAAIQVLRLLWATGRGVDGVDTRNAGVGKASHPIVPESNHGNIARLASFV